MKAHSRFSNPSPTLPTNGEGVESVLQVPPLVAGEVRRGSNKSPLLAAGRLRGGEKTRREAAE